MTENGAEERWSEADRQSIAAQGLTLEEVGRQLALFRRGSRRSV